MRVKRVHGINNIPIGSFFKPTWLGDNILYQKRDDGVYIANEDHPFVGKKSGNPKVYFETETFFLMTNKRKRHRT